MVDFLLESGRRTTRASIVQAMMTKTNAKYEADLRTMGAVVDESESGWAVCAHDELADEPLVLCEQSCRTTGTTLRRSPISSRSCSRGGTSKPVSACPTRTSSITCVDTVPSIASQLI